MRIDENKISDRVACSREIYQKNDQQMPKSKKKIKGTNYSD